VQILLILDELKKLLTVLAISLKKEFSKLGVDINQENNSLRITGKVFLDANEVSSHLDHRIAMSLSIAATKCKNPITIIKNQQ
jgi:3-phosphoshikimate 1-carboxyvinyltransferase